MVAFCPELNYNDHNLFVRGIVMRQATLTTASFFFTNSWARFMGAGYFGVHEKG